MAEEATVEGVVAGVISGEGYMAAEEGAVAIEGAGEGALAGGATGEESRDGESAEKGQ